MWKAPACNWFYTRMYRYCIEICITRETQPVMFEGPVIVFSYNSFYILCHHLSIAYMFSVRSISFVIFQNFILKVKALSLFYMYVLLLHSHSIKLLYENFRMFFLELLSLTRANWQTRIFVIILIACIYLPCLLWV